MKKYPVFPLIIVLVAALLLSGCTSPSLGNKDKNPIDGPVGAIVNGEETPLWQYDYYVGQTMQYFESINLDLEDDTVQGILPNMEAQAFEQMVTNALTIQMARELGVDITEDEMEAIFEEEIHSYFTDNPDNSYEEWLETQGLSDEQLRIFLKTQQLAKKIYEEVTKDIVGDEPMVRKMYDEAPEMYNLRSVSHILFMAQVDSASEEEIEEARNKAIDIIKRLDAGEDFAELAMEYSDDGSAMDGGKLDMTFTALSMDLVPEFVQASFELTNIGDYSKEPVETEYGFHIIKLDEKIEDFDRLKGDMIAGILQDEKEAKYGSLVEEKRDTADIKRKITFKYWLEGNEEFPLVR
ncbi:MAG: peptidylprolyl isomerase [Clostridiales bacterium]|nr:peptidylprolyl isomerase [Clostridiales bacterium]